MSRSSEVCIHEKLYRLILIPVGISSFESYEEFILQDALRSAVVIWKVVRLTLCLYVIFVKFPVELGWGR